MPSAICAAVLFTPRQHFNPLRYNACYSLATGNLLTLIAVVLTLFLGGCDTPDDGEQASRLLKRSIDHQRQGQYRAAISEARNAINLAPERPETHIQLAQVYNDLGYYNSTLRVLSEFGATDPTVVLEKATAYLELKKYRSALQWLQSSAATLDTDQLSRYELLTGLSLIGLGRTDAGRQALQRSSAGASHIPAMLAIAELEALLDNDEVAERIVQQLLVDSPKNTDVLRMAGTLAMYRGSLAPAEEYLTDALYGLRITDIMLPERISTLQLLSRVLTLAGNPREAFIYNRVLSEKVPNYVQTRTGILESLALIESGELDAAESKLLTLLEAGGNDNAGALLGIVNFLQGDISDASELLSAHLDPETAHSQALELMVSAKFQLNELDQVLSILGPEVDTRNDNPNLLGLYGLAKLARQDWSGARHIQKALQLEPENSRLRLALVAFYRQRGDDAKALHEARLAYQYEPGNPMVQGTLFQQLIDTGRIDEVRELARKTASVKPDDADTQAMTGITFLRIDDHEAAWEHLRRAVELDSENGTAWLALAQLAFTEQDYAAAETYFTYVIDILPYNPAGYKGLVGSWEARELPEKAEEALLGLTHKDSENGVPPAVLAEFLWLHQRYDEARAQIEDGLRRMAGNAYISNVAIDIYLQSARQSLQGNDLENARQHLATGLSFLPNTPALLALLARTEILDKQLETALEIAANLDILAPAIARELRGDALVPNDTAAALAAYEEAWKLTPSTELGQKIYTLRAPIDSTGAGTFKSQWQDRLPNDPGLLFINALETQQPTQRDTAIRVYQTLLKTQPRNVSALNNLAWLYYEIDNKQALPLAKQAFESAPENPLVLDTYGMVLIAQGDRDQGAAILARTQHLEPQSSEAGGHPEKEE